MNNFKQVKHRHSVVFAETASFITSTVRLFRLNVIRSSPSSASFQSLLYGRQTTGLVAQWQDWWRSDRTGGAICNVSYWHVRVQDGLDGHRASKLCSNLILMASTCRGGLFWNRDGCIRVLPYPCLVLGIKSIPWLTQSAVHGCRLKSRGGMPNIWPNNQTDHPIRRFPKTSFWDSCGLNLHADEANRKK